MDTSLTDPPAPVSQHDMGKTNRGAAVEPLGRAIRIRVAFVRTSGFLRVQFKSVVAALAHVRVIRCARGTSCRLAVVTLALVRCTSPHTLV